MQPAIVSTECPRCGAPLDFCEGSNAVRCDHCDSHLLVTGRTQLLSYTIAPTVDRRDAARTAAYAAAAAGTTARVREATLWQVPYYRVTGHDLRWEWVVTEQVAPEDREEQFFASMITDGAAGSYRSSLDEGQRQLQLRDRYVERSFLACAVEGVSLPPSLGLRPTVLRLRLFRPDQMADGCRVVAPTMPPTRAWELGAKAVGGRSAVYRRILRQVLSLVYQPMWVVALQADGAARHVMVDAVTGKTVGGADPRASVELPSANGPPAAMVVGLRPLVCPNCGWAFPLQADEVIAACGSCWRAYAIHGSELRPVDYRLGQMASHNEAEERAHLPFWVLDVSLEAERLRLHIPAFRYRRLKFLVDITRALAAKAPVYTEAQPGAFHGRGALYDEDDALALAAFVLSATDPTSDRRARQLQRAPLARHGAHLVWLPYRRERDALIDPFTGRAFLLSLLD